MSLVISAVEGASVTIAMQDSGGSSAARAQMAEIRLAPAFRDDSLSDVPLQPGVDGVVPEDAVVRLEHPVVFVREVQQLRLDAGALQGGEARQALVDRHPEIVLARDHQ